MNHDGTGQCIQCVMDAGASRHYHNLTQSIIHLDDHRRMGHNIDPEVVQFLKRLKEEGKMRADRRRAAPTEED